jgi:ProP effector
MKNASLKEQLQAVASQLSDELDDKSSPKKSMPSQRLKPRTEKPKPKWLDFAQYGVALLEAYFPACFNVGPAVKPLKKGIKQDLVKRLSTLSEIVIEDKACMVKSLAYYVNTIAYHKNMIEGQMRVDLDGQTAGCVTAEEAAYSRERNELKSQKKLPRQS